MGAPRKPARRVAEVPPHVLAELERGETESLNLVEWLAVDQRKLAEHVLPAHGLANLLPEVHSALDGLKKQTAMTQLVTIGGVLAKSLEPGGPRSKYGRLARHTSDFVRCWAGEMIRGYPRWNLAERLTAVQPFAADPHFGVRELAWMVYRPHLAADLEAAVELLIPWTASADENLRRFASEVTRPRGVWCNHIERLKQEPELALPLLDPLHADASRYVQNSVANWLNDAAKTQPAFVRRVTARWQRHSKTPATRYIVTRARRSL